MEYVQQINKLTSFSKKKQIQKKIEKSLRVVLFCCVNVLFAAAWAFEEKRSTVDELTRLFFHVVVVLLFLVCWIFIWADPNPSLIQQLWVRILWPNALKTYNYGFYLWLMHNLTFFLLEKFNLGAFYYFLSKLI